jgi:UDP-N-acetylglucosamine:LPS N-acetylglucosamine transferase
VQLTDETLPEQLLPTILALINDKEKLKQMSRAAKALDKADAAANLAKLIMRVAEGKQRSR